MDDYDTISEEQVLFNKITNYNTREHCLDMIRIFGNYEKYINKLEQENEKLKSNWDEIINNIKKAYKHSHNAEVHFVLDGLLDDMYKMQEIEEKNK